MMGLKWRFASLSKSIVKGLKQRFYGLVKTTVKGINGDLIASQQA
jgi:hypothetical protein